MQTFSNKRSCFKIVNFMHWCRRHPATVLSTPRNGDTVTPHWFRRHPAPLPLSSHTGAVITPHRCRHHPATVPSSPRTGAVVTSHRCRRHLAPVPSTPRTGAVVTPYQCRRHSTRPAPLLNISAKLTKQLWRLTLGPQQCCQLARFKTGMPV